MRPSSPSSRCGTGAAIPGATPAIGVSRLHRPSWSARTAPPPLNVLKMAHGAASSVSAKPTCWNGAPLNVATNSSERPAAKFAMVPARAPSTTSVPPDTVAVPPGLHAVDDQSTGSAVPKNSLPAAGLSITSPSAVCAMYS